MKKSLSKKLRLPLIALGGLIGLCALFALIIAMIANHPDPTENNSNLRNPLTDAENGRSALLRADRYNDEYFAANYFPTLSGARGDGVSNDTLPLREALERAGETGGTVYLPQGVYRITEPLTVPGNVTLRGDFSAPNSKVSDGAKTILLIADTQAVRSAPLITLESGASLIGVTVYYEKQSPEDIVEYPATVFCNGTTSVNRVVLLNPYHGICVTGTGAVKIQSIWISPIDYGILVTDNNASVTVEDCSVSPTYWLNYAPDVFADGEGYPALTAYLHEHMHGLILEKVTDVTLNRISVENAAVGLLFNIPKEQDGVLLVKEASVSATELPVSVVSLPKAGICFADSVFRPNNDTGADTVRIAAGADCPVIFSACTFGGLPKTVVHSDNNSFMSFYHCNFGTWWDVCFDMEGDTFLAVSPTFKTENEKAKLGQNAFGLLHNAPAIEESSVLLFSIPEASAHKTASVTVSSLKDTAKTFVNAPVINARDYGVSPEAADNTQAIAEAFEAAKEDGATVFLPEGTYSFRSIITVPDGVRLVGVGGGGKYATVLSFDLAQHTDFSLVELRPGASVEDLEVRQASILAGSVNTYAVSSMYPDVRICRVTVNAGRGIWLTTAENAVLEHITANVTRTGVYLQAMKNVLLRDITVTDPSGSYGTVGMRLENSAATLSGFRGVNLEAGLELTGNTDLNATLITLRGPSCGIRAEHTGKATLTALGFSEAGKGGQTVFLKGSEAMTGAVTLQGLISAGPAILGNLADLQNGTAEIRAGIFTTPFATTVTTGGKADLEILGCIWDTYPTCHAAATQGSITLEANLLRSDKTFEGTEGNYLITSAGENATVKDGVNVIQHVYVYVESEDATAEQPPQE